MHILISATGRYWYSLCFSLFSFWQLDTIHNLPYKLLTVQFLYCIHGCSDNQSVSDICWLMISADILVSVLFAEFLINLIRQLLYNRIYNVDNMYNHFSFCIKKHVYFVYLGSILTYICLYYIYYIHCPLLSQALQTATTSLFFYWRKLSNVIILQESFNSPANPF